MSMLNDIFIAPFTEFEFMRRALAGALALALGAGPIGVFLMPSICSRSRSASRSSR